MSEIWLVSYIALWALVLLLMLICLALARQIGLIHRRLLPFPAKATPEGPAVGEQLKPIVVEGIGNQSVIVGGETSQPRMYVFVGANCPACDELAPSVRSISKSDAEEIQLVLVSVGGTSDDNRRFVERNRLSTLPYVVAPEVVSAYGIVGTPFAIVADERGVVRAKGVANHLEHLESLLAALVAPGSRGSTRGGERVA